MSEEHKEYALTPVSEAGLMPAVSIQVAVDRFNQLGHFVRQIMKPGIDYGVIPGTNDKPTLKKPGAEKLKTFFGMTNAFEILRSVEDWDKPLFYYLVRCHLYRDGVEVGQGDGSCNSRESKYRYRQAERTCPACHKPTIIKGKQEYGGGWLCYQKKGGCGAKFKAGDPAIEGQQVGRIENPDIADQVNTIIKQAEKRSLVAAVLITVNASEFFTQDLEDWVEAEYADVTPPAEEPAPPAPTDKPTNGKAHAKEPDLDALKRAFFNKVLMEIPYYNHGNHIVNTLKGMGFGKYDPERETEMWDALQKHANEKANEKAAQNKPPTLDEELEAAQVAAQRESPL